MVCRPPDAFARRCIAASLALGCFGFSGTLRAQTDLGGDAGSIAPTPDQIQLAAEAFDRGRDAYKEERFAEAAEQFERADANAPSATALELAIRARDRAGDLDRAATLSLLALARYESEIAAEETGIGKLAPPILERARAELHELTVSCSAPCQLVDGTKLVHGNPALVRVIFLAPGHHDLVAGFGEGRTAARSVDATPGGSGELRFEAPPATEPVAEPAAEPEPEEEVPAAPPADTGGGWSPTVFFVGAGLTAVAGGVTVWSGLDTVNNPGEDRVREECAAGDEDCELYKDGRAKQLRTNVLIGVTGALAVFTGVAGALFTNWGGTPATRDSGASRLGVRPYAGWNHGPTLGAKGTF